MMFFSYRISIYLLIYVLLFREGNVQCSKECSSGDGSCSSGREKRTSSLLSEIRKEYNRMIENIKVAVSSYQEPNGTSCDYYMRTMKKDLGPFEKGINKDMVDSVRWKGIKYLIYDQKLYRDKECMFPSRCSGIEHFMLQLLPNLQNMELIINVRDWPQINRHFQMFGPVFSFSKTADYLDIMYPAWSFWEGGPVITIYPTGIGRWDLHRKSLLEEGKTWPWEKKKSMGFFRGSRTSEKRDTIVLLSRKRPDLVEANYTKNQAWKSSEDTLGAEPASIVSMEYHCQYKYLFNFRGVAASFRFKHLFLCGSLVIHVGDEWIEFFYPAMKPWVHYIPLPEKFTEHDVTTLIDFLRDNDALAREIAERGQKFVSEHLRMKEVKCYWRRLLKRYGKLIKYPIEFDNSLIRIN
ncbi:UNVERIFIED_CONTAM: hypothetical protein PYX00_009548 [Menopon gallinae]|uniref:Glycosyl transferase CAP10 domain-containing protein n=1 Tax=Menopon gallinae TaxID=328185 RepID=A0AAW2HCD4_9NEOP